MPGPKRTAGEAVRVLAIFAIAGGLGLLVQKWIFQKPAVPEPLKAVIAPLHRTANEHRSLHLSRTTFRQIHKGMTLKEVEAILGGPPADYCPHDGRHWQDGPVVSPVIYSPTLKRDVWRTVIREEERRPLGPEEVGGDRRFTIEVWSDKHGRVRGKNWREAVNWPPDRSLN